MNRDDYEWGLQGPDYMAVRRGMTEDINRAQGQGNTAGAVGHAVRGGLAIPVAMAADAGRAAGQAAYENIGEPLGRFGSALLGGPTMPAPTEEPAPVVPKPTTLPAPPPPTRQNPVTAPVAAATTRRAVDTSKYPYGLDLKKLAAAIPMTQPPAVQAPGLQAAPARRSIPKAPAGAETGDLTKKIASLMQAAQFKDIPNFGGFGDIMNYRMSLGMLGNAIAPLALERMRREKMAEDAMKAYEMEQTLGLKLGDQDISRGRLEFDRENAARKYGLDLAGHQWGQVKDVMDYSVAQSDLARKSAADQRTAMYDMLKNRYSFDYLDPQTEQVMSGTGLLLGVGPEGPVTMQLSGPQQIQDPFSGVY